MKLNILRILIILGTAIFYFGSAEVLAIKVLTYNICWECMTNNNDGKNATGSAAKLGKLCAWVNKSENKTLCAKNIAEEIDMTADHYKDISNNPGYDFVGLQEATNWQVLQKDSAALNMMKAVSHKSGVNSMVSFYDAKKYNLKKSILSEFEPGRLFQILIFEQPYIFINLHAPHDPSIRKISEMLSAALTANFPDVNKLQNHRIIMVGDFNDHSGKFWSTQEGGTPFIPFFKTTIKTPVYLQSEPEKTCCSNAVPFPVAKVKTVGDYILDSVKQTKSMRLKVPSQYDATKPKSDHLPVIYEAK